MGYKLKYIRAGLFGFNSEKQEYEEGEPVKVTYFPLGTDTSYSFHADADDVVVHRNDDVAEITFTMPAHDVEVTCTSRSTMGVCGPNNNLFMGIGSSAPLQNTPQAPVSDSKGSTIDTEWICPNCQTKNAGKFCCGCGTPRQ
jgi:hypothetical protein